MPDEDFSRYHLKRVVKPASTACFHATGLKPWMRMYAEWLALQPGRPANAERQAIVNRLAHEKVSPKALRHLEQRTDFIEYHDKIALGSVTAARAKLEAESPWYIEQHRLGLEAAMAAHDYKAVTNFTAPVVERVWPRREGPVNATQITIHISPRQIEGLDRAPAQMLEGEIVPEPETPE